MSGRMLVLMALVACLAGPVAAWPFGDSEEEQAAEVATRVAEALREPNRLIVQAQEATQKGDVEEAIRLFRRAQTLIEQTEASEDTSGPAWSSLRMKKFLCLSALDALALERAEVLDVRQAVTDTSELERRLAEERAALRKEEDAKVAKEKLLEAPKPPTLREQLPDVKRNLEAAKAARAEAEQRLTAAKTRHEEALKARAEAQSAENAAKVALRAAEQKQVAAEAQAAQAGEGLLAGAFAADSETSTDEAQAQVKAATQARGAQEDAVDSAAAHLQVAEVRAVKARKDEADAQALLDALEKAIAKERADAEAKERAAQLAAKQEQERLAAEALARRQAQAAAEAKAREAARQRAQLDAQAKAKAEADAKARATALAECETLWAAKRVDALEAALLKHAVAWPEEPGFLLYLARLRLLQGRPDDALEIVGTVPAGSAADFEAQLVAAGAFLTKNRPDEAMRILERAAKAKPNDPRPYFNLAVAFLRLPTADPDRAIAARFYAKSVSLGGKRSYDLERRLNME